ncbi:MAG: succinate dehydrogenase iron-sulfur subunit [Phycisphaerae bacterium]|jgi:succinate dehydrogenase / fumarate reductase iron-sulfur subunit|nr:succinate dehydrogenase iron-sulfur subunit [Phycisphaerae bacterium]
MVAPTTPSSRPESNAGSARRTVRFRILRRDRPDGATRWEEFDVPVEPGANIISCLQWIAANPRTVDGRESTPVVYDAGCLEEVCGSCTMVINGRVRQSCSALIDNLLTEQASAGGVITLEPMSKFPTLRDLSVDRARFFDALKRAKAWVPIDGTYSLGAGPKESSKTQETRYTLSTCMTCGCCLEACPQYNQEEDAAKWPTSFLGAAVISQARLFNMHQTGAELTGDRLDLMMGQGGINDCGNSQNCVKVCPKEIPLTESIAAIGRATTVHAIKSFFSGR